MSYPQDRGRDASRLPRSLEYLRQFAEANQQGLVPPRTHLDQHLENYGFKPPGDEGHGGAAPAKKPKGPKPKGPMTMSAPPVFPIPRVR